MSDRPGILFAGGGTGGHIYPNMAIAEAMACKGFTGPVRFMVSDRMIDRRIMSEGGYGYDVSLAKGWSWSAMGASRCIRAVAQARRIVRKQRIGIVVSTGGFVGGTTAMGGKLAGAEVVLINVDAAWGRANRLLRRLADQAFCAVGECGNRIGVPLRRDAVWEGGVAGAKHVLGLDEGWPVLLIIGGSQGATSVNRTMAEAVSREPVRDALRGWQVLHVVGKEDVVDETQAAYERAGIRAVAMGYCSKMGAAWGAADLAISRAGALSVAESLAAGTPTIFLPYPHHRDRHQYRNVEDLVRQKASVMLDDADDPVSNAERLSPVLVRLLGDDEGRSQMRLAMHQAYVPDGAGHVAGWLLDRIGTP